MKRFWRTLKEKITNHIFELTIVVVTFIMLLWLVMLTEGVAKHRMRDHYPPPTHALSGKLPPPLPEDCFACHSH